MLKSSTRQQRIPGQVIEIALGQGKRSYARVLNEPLFAFYDKVYDINATPTLDEIITLPIAFKIDVMNSAVTSGRWSVIGKVDLSENLNDTPKFCKQDIITGELFIYQEVPELAPYFERRASFEECDGLETAAVWEAEHVEDRLRDHFAGQPNKWVEQLKIRRQ
jgi:hypothetical protein